jgi:hypothetical protein
MRGEVSGRPPEHERVEIASFEFEVPPRDDGDGSSGVREPAGPLGGPPPLAAEAELPRE